MIFSMPLTSRVWVTASLLPTVFLATLFSSTSDAQSTFTQASKPVVDIEVDIPEPVDGFDSSVLLRGSHDIPTLIITAEFADQKISYHESVWASRIQSTDPDAKTLHHYFSAASNGQISMTPATETFGVDNDGVIGRILLEVEEQPVKLPGVFTPMLHPNTGDQTEGLSDTWNKIFKAAIRGADPYIDFSLFDKDGNAGIDSDELAIFVVVAGYEASSALGAEPAIHGHAITNFAITDTEDVAPPGAAFPGSPVKLSGHHAMIGERGVYYGEDFPATLGLFAHEAGHVVFGLPDLYQRDGTSSGIGVFGLMGTGNWGMDPTVDSFPGETPVLPSAWTLLSLRWFDATTHFADPLIAAGSPVNSIGHQPSGSARIGLVVPGTIDPDTGIADCISREWFLLQYRAPIGYDRGLSALYNRYTGEEYSGLAIYHVNENRSDNEDEKFKMVDIEEASGITVDQSLANKYMLWVDDGENATLFDKNSYPDSDFGFFGTAESGVSVNVGSPTVDSNNLDAIALTVQSLCQDTGTTVVINFP